MSWLDTIVSKYPGWTLIGILLVLGGAAKLILKTWNRFMRHLNIGKHGCPPPHCDADDDFKEEEGNHEPSNEAP